MNKRKMSTISIYCSQSLLVLLDVILDCLYLNLKLLLIFFLEISTNTLFVKTAHHWPLYHIAGQLPRGLHLKWKKQTLQHFTSSVCLSCDSEVSEPDDLITSSSDILNVSAVIIAFKAASTRRWPLRTIATAFPLNMCVTVLGEYTTPSNSWRPDPDMTRPMQPKISSPYEAGLSTTGAGQRWWPGLDCDTRLPHRQIVGLNRCSLSHFGIDMLPGYCRLVFDTRCYRSNDSHSMEGVEPI